MSCKHEQKDCPRCNAVLTCKAGQPSACQCSGLTLSDDTLKFLERTYFNCLCRNCLIAIDLEVKIAKGHLFPTQKEFLIEGLHYYKEAGSIVFTELYHVLRGYCCKNNCRHCAYGFSNNVIPNEPT